MATAENPLSFGVVIFPGFQALDVFGPLDALNTLAANHAPAIKLSVIAATLDPVSTQPPNSGIAFSESVVPTHTFETAPPLDVLLLPGGAGTLDQDNIQGPVEFTAKVFPSLKYLLTFCTGSIIATKAGVLDGRRATTNKQNWKWATSFSDKVEWVTHARWVVDGNVWTSSGVSAGLDEIIAWIEHVYGEAIAKAVTETLEYDRHTDASWDPFADIYGL